MYQNSAILAKNCVRIETPTQEPHLPDLSWRIVPSQDLKKLNSTWNWEIYVILSYN